MPSRRNAVASAVDRVLEAVQEAHLSAGRRHDLAVAVSEALSNAAVHGNRLSPTRTVGITVEVVPEKMVTVEVRDSGRGFDTEDLSDPTEPSHLLNPTGRGVFLMRKLVDKLEYNEVGNVVLLTVRRRPRRRRRDH